jgi:cytochrome c-type biogenesis protein CcsB
MVEIEKLFLFAAIIICGLSCIFNIIGWIFSRNTIFKTGRWLTVPFLACVTGTIVVRWQYQGHGPYITLYEVLLSNVWVATVVYLIVTFRRKSLEAVGVFATPILLLTVGAVALSPAQASNLTPAYKSIWLILHITFAKLTYGSILVATALSISILLNRYLKKESHLIMRLTEPNQADRLCHKLVAASLIFASIMIVSGSIWANQLWGKYWGWDPVEVWSLITWIVYGLYLHLRITYSFKGVAAAIYCIVSFVVSAVSFFIMPYVLNTVHNSFMFAK